MAGVTPSPEQPEHEEARSLRERAQAAETRERGLLKILEQIADHSYVGNYRERDVVEIYRKWARHALDKVPGGDPAVVHPSDSLAESQAESNGPSGSPTSPPGRVTAEHEEARRDRLAELYDIEDEGRMREYALRSPESAAADLSSLLAKLSKAEQELEDALEAGRALEEQRNVAVQEVERLREIEKAARARLAIKGPLSETLKERAAAEQALEDALSADTQREDG